jgi:hypothetical protein
MVQNCDYAYFAMKLLLRAERALLARSFAKKFFESTLWLQKLKNQSRSHTHTHTHTDTRTHTHARKYLYKAQKRSLKRKQK